MCRGKVLESPGADDVYPKKINFLASPENLALPSNNFPSFMPFFYSCY